ncbi:MAG TPA: hypothetical protein VFQ05_08870 [Candidatus Eisenbacteria bacterium]|nr:hypothetical protein [Candidatus Eisenbacteria bacterium]
MKHARLSKSLWALGAVAIVAMIAFAGCTFVGDNITGVKAGAGPTSCVKQCNDLYKTLYDQEQKTHQTNVETCQAQSQPDRGECLAAEDARHTSAQASLGAGKIECQNNCHRQGAGSAG